MDMTEIIYLLTIFFAGYVIDEVTDKKPVFMLLAFMMIMFMVAT